MQREGAAKKTSAIIFETQSEGLREPSRPDADQRRLLIRREASMASHRRLALEGFARSQEHRGRPAGGLTDDIDTSVDPVAAVCVDPSRRAEHRLISFRRARVRVGRRVGAVPEIGFDLGDPHDESLAVRQTMNQPTADQFRSDGSAITGVEALCVWATEGHGRSIGQECALDRSSRWSSLEDRDAAADALYDPRDIRNPGVTSTLISIMRPIGRG